MAFKIHRMARLLRRHLAEVTTRLAEELTPEQWFILNRLRRLQAAHPGELADSVLEDRPNITRLLAGLERRRLIRRAPDPEDGRRQIVELSPRGRRIHDQIAEQIPRVRRELFQGVSSHDVQAMVRVIDTMADNISRTG